MAMSRLVSLLGVSAVLSLVACSAGSVSEEAVQGDPQALTECDGNGTWAIKVSTPVKWNASFVLQAGTGTVTNWLRTARVQNGLEVTDTAEICGVQTPDYQAAALFGSEKYGIRFPDATFGTLPKFELKGTLSSKEIGATFTAPPSAALVGATLASPISDPWPAAASLTAVDVDGDGKPGLSADAATEVGMSNPPVNPTRTVRADRVYATFRQVLDASTGTVSSCSRVDGTAKISVIAGKAAIDSHVLGCRHAGDGAECTPAEHRLLDTAAPVYVPTGDAVITMIKLPAGRTAPTCADVRALDYAAAARPPAPPCEGEPVNGSDETCTPSVTPPTR